MRRALVFLVFAGLVGCAKESPQPEPSKPPPRAEIFKNITAESGIAFSHGADTNYAMPFQIGSGAVIFDYNNDARLDLYFVQNGGPGLDVANKLFRQEADGRFTEVGKEAGLNVSATGMGAIAGDFNNDGRPDLVLTEYGKVRLFQNADGTAFKEITGEAGVDNPRWAVPASFIDFDRDGWLDLVVGNYVDYDPTQICKDQQGRQEFCAPGAFPATPTRLWRNITGTPGAPARFEDWTVRSAIFRHPGVALGLVCADFTGDHWPDIFCSDDGRPNRLFVNQHNGTFTEEAAARGLAYDAMGRTAANMGVAYADLTGDGMGDLFVTHLAEEFHSFFSQDRPGLFMDTIAQAGLQQQGWRGTGFGTVAVDFNQDGFVDIAFVNGLVRRAVPGQEPVLAGVDPWWGRYAQRSQLFLNDRGKFRDVSSENAAFCGMAAVGRSLAAGDLNNDGAPDLVVANVGGPAQIFRNIAPPRGHWLKLRLILPERGGRDAIGAEVRLSAGKRLWWSVLQPATSYLASHEPVLHFGLGELVEVETAEVVWPDGEIEVFEIRAVDRFLTLRKGEGKRQSR